MKLLLITGNKTKLRNAIINLRPFGIEVYGREMETPEIQSTDVEEIARYSAIFAQNQLKSSIIKMDVCFEIDCLNGFPGPFVKFINNWLSPDQILKMMVNEINRKARFIDVICYADNDGHTKIFKMMREGVITSKAKGDDGWGVDRIFIPEGFSKTLAEMNVDERANVWGNEHWEELAKYVLDINNK